MVELNNVDQASGGAGCTQRGDAAETPRKIATVADLNEEQLEGIFSEEDPHKQFEFFTSCLGLPKPECMSILSRIAAEYDYLNVMFCREQNFTAEQTIAFRGITKSVFEAGIVRGELDVNEAFQEFTDRVLSLAGEPDTTTAQHHRSPGNEPSATALTSGVSANGDGDGGGGENPPAAETRRVSGKNSPKVVAGSKSKEVVVDPKNSARGNALASIFPGGENGGGGETNGAGGSGSGSGSGGGSGGGSGSGSGGGGAGTGPVFSVGDVAAITLFVARGLYRNFALYRMCFEQPAKHCTEVRDVQVETPLEPPPLHEAEPLA